MIKRLLKTKACGGGNFSLTTLSIYAVRFGNIAQRIVGDIVLHLNNVEVPKKVKIGKNVQFIHNAYGTVIHPSTEIEDDVEIYQNVTCGRGDCWVKSGSKFKGIIIKKGACICPGAKIICSEGMLIIGENTVIGANAVLTKSTGDNEIWAGVPAKFIRNRNESNTSFTNGMHLAASSAWVGYGEPVY